MLDLRLLVAANHTTDDQDMYNMPGQPETGRRSDPAGPVRPLNTTAAVVATPDAAGTDAEPLRCAPHPLSMGRDARSPSE